MIDFLIANVSDLIVFALLGLLAGAAARLWYPGRGPIQILGTMLVGAAGALLGGMLSWTMWPDSEGLLYPGALLTSLLGAALLLVLSAWVGYARSASGAR